MFEYYIVRQRQGGLIQTVALCKNCLTTVFLSANSQMACALDAPANHICHYDVIAIPARTDGRA